jgi:hypothetical protein
MLPGARSARHRDYLRLGHLDALFLFKIRRNLSIDKTGDGSVSRSRDGSATTWVGDGGRAARGEKGEVMGLDDGIEGKRGALLELTGGAVAAVDEDGRESKLEADLATGATAFHGEETWGRGVVRHGRWFGFTRTEDKPVFKINGVGSKQ